MILRVRTLFTTLAVATLTMGMPVSAAGIFKTGFVEDLGAADRIEAGERIRTLTQKLGSAACHLHAEVDVEVSEKILNAGVAEFDKLIDALEFGDESLHIIGGEEKPRMLRHIASLRKEWAVVRPAYKLIKADHQDREALEVIFDETNKMLKAASILVAELEGEYTNPTELLQSDMLLIEVSGQQAMATQRLSFEACRIWSGHGNEKDREELKQYTAQFEFAVKALLTGQPQLGLMPAPNAAIADKLTKAVSDWDDIRWKLENLAENSSISTEEATKLCRILFKKMAVMEKVSHMYVEHSRRVYQ